MQKVSVFLFLAMMSLGFLSFRPAEKSKIQWMTIQEVQAVYSKNPKPILVDVYTSWCGWCKVMDAQTYTNDKVANYINEKYYAVKFDAESRDSILWNGKKYGYNAQNKANDLAVYMLGGQLMFPTTVFLATLDGQPAPLAGYLKPKEIEPPLRFFGDGIYKTKNFPDFSKNFTASW